MFGDLADAERVVIGTPSSPVGQYAREALDLARETEGPALISAIFARVASEESNAGLVRAKVLLGEADAAFVYRTDALHADLRALELPRPVHATYVIAPTRTENDAAAAFAGYVQSDEAQALLRELGFEAAQ